MSYLKTSLEPWRNMSYLKTSLEPWRNMSCLKTSLEPWRNVSCLKTSLEPWRNMSYLKLDNTTTRIRLKNRLNLLLHTVWTCSTHFSDDQLLILMTVYNFRCLYDILHHLEEHSARLINFRYKVAYIFSQL